MSESDDDEPRYEWSSNGGCERCDAMDGHLCKEPSPRPHPHCDCTIIDRSRPASTCDSSDVQYDVVHSGSIHHGGSGDDDEFEIVFDYTIVCWGNAQTISGEVTVTRTYGEQDRTEPGDLLDDAWVEALDKVEQIALDECPVCGDHPSIA